MDLSVYTILKFVRCRVNGISVKVKKLCDRAKVFSYGTEFSAGADIYAMCDENIEILPGECKLIHTGIALAIPSGYVGLIFARSGLATKKGLAPSNKVGVIDSDYRGEIMVSLYNQSNELRVVEDGERIAQISFLPYYCADFDVCDELDDTVRGNGGFGSTGER